MPLTDIQVRNAKAKDKPYKKFDSEGLYILVSQTKKQNRGKCWRLKYYFDGKEKHLPLGTYPEVSLAEARRRRDDARRQVANGIDPAQTKKSHKAEVLEKKANTFKKLAIDWIDRHASERLANKTQEMVNSRLKNDVYPVIGNTPLTDLTANIVLEQVLRPIEERGAIESAHRLRGLISQILRYGVACGLCDRDFTVDLRGALKPIQRNHHAAFDADGTTDPKKVGGLLRAIDGFEGYFVTKCALKLHPLFATRPGELRQAEWNEFNFKTATWTIPPGRMKMKNAHIVPLSKQALGILQELHQLTGHGKYLFPSVRSTERPISDNTLNAALRRLGYSKDEFVSHGWRAVFRTLADEELGERLEIIETQLAHQVSDPLGRAYNRTSFIKERREMMQRWADYLGGLKAGTKFFNHNIKGVDNETI